MLDLNKLDDKQFAKVFAKLIEKIKEDPIENYIKAKGFIDLKPTPAQEVIFKVIFQKPLDPVSLKTVKVETTTEEGTFELEEQRWTEYQIYNFLTEKVYDPKILADSDSIKINKIDLICGRRSGKTLIASVLATYCAISNNWKPFLKKTPFATVLVMSHSKEFSDEVLAVIKNLISESPILSRLIDQSRKQTQSTMNIKTPWIVKNKVEYSLVQIKVGAASSKTTRGIAACAILCDEIAYWNLDESMKETDSKILKAVRPAMAQFGDFGMLFKLSSPGIKQGILYKEYDMHKNGTLPDSYAVFKAPSWLMNNILPTKNFLEEWVLDKDGFDVEYRANFADSLSNFISPELTALAVLNGVKLMPPSENRETKYFASIDAAFKRDKFTFTIVGVRENRITQYLIKGFEGSKTNPVKAHNVADFIKNSIKSFPVDHVAADQFAFQPLQEIFLQYGIELKEYPFTQTFKKKIYFNLKKLIHSQQIDLLDHQEMIKEINELVVEQSSMGNIKIGHPAGGHDDFSDVVAVASYLATQGQTASAFEFDIVSSSNPHKIKTDQSGRAFTAPSVGMLVDSGYLPETIYDNSGEYTRDPKTGKLRRLIDEDEDDYGDLDDDSGFSIG